IGRRSPPRVFVQPSQPASAVEPGGQPADSEHSPAASRPRTDPTSATVGGVDDAAAVRQLGMFIRWLLPAAYFFTGLMIVVFIAFPQWPIALNASLIAGYAAWLTIAWRRLQREHFTVFVRRVALGILLLI